MTVALSTSASRVLTCTAPRCQEFPLRVIYQSRQDRWVSSVRLPRITVLGGGQSLTAHLPAGNTVSIHETSPTGHVRPMAGGSSRLLAGPSCSVISPKGEILVSLKSHKTEAMLYPGGSLFCEPNHLCVLNCTVKQYKLSHSITSISSVSTLTNLNHLVIEHHVA
jgi:hypothetical protein